MKKLTLIILCINIINSIECLKAAEIETLQDNTSAQIFASLFCIEKKVAQQETLDSITEYARLDETFKGKSLIDLLAAYYRNTELKYLLQKGANPNEAGDIYPSPLYSAIVASNVEGTRLLLAHGANIVTENNKPDACITGSNPFLCAVHKYPVTQDDLDIVASLLEHTDIIKVLNKKGKAPDNKECTPLEILIKHAIKTPNCRFCSTTADCITEEKKNEHLKLATRMITMLQKKGATLQ